MTQRLKFAFVALLAAGAACFAPAARADQWDKLTVMTFNEPVEIPGKVLPAGTYVFKLADSESDRNIVQIFTEDQQHLLATILAVPAYRPEPADKTLVTFEERPSGTPEAVHKWFYPGENYGVEFVYKKAEQQYAAKAEPPVTAPAAEPAPVQPVAATQPEPVTPSLPPIIAEEELIFADATPVLLDNTGDSDRDATPETLPQTAGNFALIPLLGGVLLSGGFTAIRRAARQN